jgi:uncharacterized protein with ParB-like and HNH nuclease domain
MAFKAQQRKVSDLLTGSILEIPRNQRRYVWKEEHWNDLLSDLSFAIEANDPTKKHFIGSIVLKEEGSVNGINHFTIIDGQQRTFTLLLFLTAIMLLFKERGMENDFRGNSKLLIATDLKNQSFCILNSDFYLSLSKVVLKVCDWNDHSSLSEIMKNDVKNKKVEKSLVNCITYYYNVLKQYSNDKVLTIRDALIETNFVEIIATTEEDSYTIFEILNARGQVLEDHELLKNYIMRYIRPQEQTKIDEVKIRWTDDIDKGLGNSIKKFFKHYTTHKYSTTKKDSIYKTIQRSTPNKDVNTLFEDILKKVEYYKTILKPIAEGEEYNCSLFEYQIFSFFANKKAEQFRPMFLSLMHQRDLNTLEEEKYKRTLNYLYLFFVCYNIIGEEKSNKLEDPIYKYSPILENNFSDKALNEFFDSLNKRLPTEEVFVNIFRNVGWSNHTAFYNDSNNKERVKLILEILERNKSGQDISDYTLEHILPDSENEENAQIGNILPLEEALNRRCRNLSLNKKIPIYKESRFAITRGFATRFENNPESFSPVNRTKFLAGLVYNFIFEIKNDK